MFTAMLVTALGFGLLCFAIGWWLYRDANRLDRHVSVMVDMIDAGVPECEAIERSGCNFWDVPWYRRLFRPYPVIQAERR